MAGAKGKSGGTRPGSGGARAGSGRKPGAKTLFDRAFVGPMLPKRRAFASAEERKAATKERDRKKSAAKSRGLAEKREMDRLLNGRKKYARTTSYVKVCGHCSANFVSVLDSGKYCSYECRVAAHNQRVSDRSLVRNRQVRACAGCGVMFCNMDNTVRTTFCDQQCKSRSLDAKRRMNDPLYRLRCRVRSLIHMSLKSHGKVKDRATQEILGCTVKEFQQHIERQFLPGMSWELGGEIHIDHIVPSASAKTETELLALNHFTNLRPLWAADNLSKGAQITHLI